MKRMLMLLLSLILFVPAAVNAAEWKLDPDHTNFYFDVKHVYSTVRGSFPDFSGKVVFDPEQPEKSSFRFEVKVASVNTMVTQRDTHLRSADFFDAGKYPVMTFQSTGVSRVKDNVYRVAGKMTIKDVTKDVALDFVYHGEKVHPLQPKMMATGLDTRFTLDRLEYHVGDGKFYKMGAVGKDVDVLITLEMLRDR